MVWVLTPPFYGMGFNRGSMTQQVSIHGYSELQKIHGISTDFHSELNTNWVLGIWTYKKIKKL